MRGVSRHYPGRGRTRVVRALDDVTLEVAAGECVALVGESGAGKSTLARVALGIEAPDAGTVHLAGREVSRSRGRARRELRRQTHLVFQDPYQSLHPGMRVGTLVGEPLAIARRPRAERHEAVAAALEEVGLTPAGAFLGRLPHELSGGQRQRVALARAIVHRPRLIVADEPTSMLDASLCAGVLQLLLDIRARHATTIVSITHDLAVARYVSERIVVMKDGRVVEEGETEDLIARPRTAYAHTLLEACEGHVTPDAGPSPTDPTTPPRRSS